MADDRSMAGEPDRRRLSPFEVYEAGYRTDKYGVAADRLKAAAEAAEVLPMRSKSGAPE